MGLFKIFLGFGQIISTLSVNLPAVPWPSFLITVWNGIGVVTNIDLLSAISVDCVTSTWDFFDHFIVTISYPVVVLCIIAAVTFIRASVADEDDKNDIYVEGWKVSLFGLFLVYPSLTSTILRVWHCRDINGTQYLVADYRLVCVSSSDVDSKWLGYAMIAGVAFMCYAVGIPLLFSYLLYRNRHALHDVEHPNHAECASKLGFLYKAYTPKAWWWENVLLAHKLALTGLIIFIKPDTTSQLAAGFFISFLFLILHLLVNAYAENEEFELQTNSMISITMTLFGGILLKTDTQDEDANGLLIMSILLVAVNVLVILLFCQGTIEAIRNPPQPNNPARKVLINFIEALLAKAQPRINRACASLGLSEEEAGQLKEVLLSLESEVPKALEAMEDLEAVVQEVESSLTTSKSPEDLLDSLLSVTRIVLGNEIMQPYMEPYTEMLMSSFEESLRTAGCSEDTLALCNPLAVKLNEFFCNNGITSFTLVWGDIVTFAFDECGGAEAALARLDDFLGAESGAVMAPLPVMVESEAEYVHEEESELNSHDKGPLAVSIFTEEQEARARKIFDRYDLVSSLFYCAKYNLLRSIHSPYFKIVII